MSLEAGKYLGGMLGNFDVNAEKNALKGNQKASDAVTTAKANTGAEIAVIDGAGNTTVHKVAVDKGTFSHPKATASGLVTVDNLAAPNAKVDKTKPLAIDPGIAGMLGGDVAILVDEKNQTQVIGANKNAAAEKFLNSPTAQKVDAAYTTAGDDNFVNKKMASNTVNKLTANYRNTGEAAHDIGLLKDGQVKTVMNNVIAELTTISANTSQLETERKNRDAKFNGDIVKPQERLDKANSSWASANSSETAKVQNASENLREAQFPGVHEAESSLDRARNMVNDGKGYLQNAAKEVTSATGEVNRLETLKSTTTNLSNATQDLKMTNKGIVNDMANYLVTRRDQLSTLKSTLNDKSQYYNSLADVESRKPAAPADPAQTPASGGNSATSDPFSNGNKPASGNSATSDPFNKPSGSSTTTGNSSTSDPFNKPSGTKPSTGNSATSDPFNKPSGNKPAGGNSATSDPFSGGNSKPSGGNSATADPFSNSGSTSGQYRNDSTVNDLRRRANETRSDANILDMRVQSLNSVINEARMGGMEGGNFRRAIEKMPDNYSYNSYSYAVDPKNNSYFTDQNSDKAVIVNNFVRPYDDNSRTIRNNTQTVQNNVAEYKAKIDPANQRLEQAKVSEAQASGNLAGAQSTVTQVTSELQRINSKAPLDTSVPTVKTAKNALDSASKHMENTVGENAPLTKEKNSAQGAVDGIKAEHNDDVKAINDKITNNANQAQQKINATKKSLGI